MGWGGTASPWLHMAVIGMRMACATRLPRDDSTCRERAPPSRHLLPPRQLPFVCRKPGVSSFPSGVWLSRVLSGDQKHSHANPAPNLPPPAPAEEMFALLRSTMLDGTPPNGETRAKYTPSQSCPATRTTKNHKTQAEALNFPCQPRRLKTYSFVLLLAQSCPCGISSPESTYPPLPLPPATARLHLALSEHRGPNSPSFFSRLSAEHYLFFNGIPNPPPGYVAPAGASQNTWPAIYKNLQNIDYCSDTFKQVSNR